MSFFGRTFVFNSIPSETFNLFISSPDGSDVQTTGTTSVQLYTQTIYRRPKPYLYGTQQTPVLEFSVSVNAPDEIVAEHLQKVQRWLFGHSGYKKLQIMQCDMQDVYFNCILNNPQIKRVGNKVVGIGCDVICDSPFAWQFPKTLTKTYTDPTVSDSFYFDNLSDDNYYLYPSMTITMNASGGDISITDVTDDSREFLVEDLSPGEVLTIDNDLQIFTSDTGLRRLGNFNKNWMRFVPGRNTIQVSGSVAEITFTTSFARKMA